ncbi:hypothetical protein ACFQ8C_11280 [Streptomyces sp. NPDC056503]|uniref:hypothetical protein n=1 Tax=Streptomyces sp. NPDC056503 TaxID=3345842 RepID=UPI003693F8D2
MRTRPRAPARSARTLDLRTGTGTGVLALAAARRGARTTAAAAPVIPAPVTPATAVHGDGARMGRPDQGRRTVPAPEEGAAAAAPLRPRETR